MPPRLGATRFGHVNLVARDWKQLAQFYCDVFGCEAVGVERDYTGPLVDRATGVSNGRIQGQHFRLPGLGENGPTLEIFQYDPQDVRPPVNANQTGFVHIAFQVDNIELKRQQVLDAGGSDVGEITEFAVPPEGMVTIIYMRDPESNMIELQKWQAHAATEE